MLLPDQFYRKNI